jgi:predicted nucleotidyltransferase
MVKREIIKIKIKLKTLLQKRGISIEKIVVFGSYAKGKEKEYSDIDIIIVSKDFREKDIFQRVELTRGIHRKLIDEIMKPFDIMYYSDEEWKKGHSLIINAAKEEGVVIFG